MACVLGPGHLASQDPAAEPLELEPLLTVQGPRVRLGERWGLSVGAAVTFIGDVDGDRVSDLAIGSTTPYETDSPGTLRLHSGADGSLIRQTRGGSTGFSGALCRLGDIDGDGIPDVLVAEQLLTSPSPRSIAVPNRAQVVACSGADLLPIWQRDLGPGGLPLLGTAGDLDGDGVTDAFAVTSGRLSALSGRVGATIFTCNRQHLSQDVASLATLVDVDGDGLADALLGSGNHEAVVVSGADGSILHEFRGRGVEWERFGWTVAGLGDVDDDGIPDGAIGAGRGGRDRSSRYQPDGGPWVRIFSGGGGEPISEFDIQTALHGTRIGAAGDVDGDGIPDLATGGASLLQVHSAAHGRVIASRRVVNPDFPGGWPGYGHRSLGGHLDCHDQPGLFVVAATNFWGEGLIDVIGPAD